MLPTPYSRGPWDRHSLHGGPVCALMAHEAEIADGDPGLVTVRVTLELLRPVPQDLLTPRCILRRPGKKVRIYEVTLSHDGQEVARAQVLRLRTVDAEVPGSTHDDPSPFPDPLDCPEAPFLTEGYVNIAHGTEIRVASGADTAFSLTGAASCWFRLRVPLLEGEPIDATSTALIASDFGNGISAALPIATHVYINPDLTVYLHRRPRGTWIANAARTWIHPGDTALAEADLWDTSGPLGRATQSLVVTPR